MPKVKTPRNSSPSKQVITMPEAGSTLQPKKNLAPSTPIPIDLESQIRQRAYELYQQRGEAIGDPNEDWLRAEREVRARYEHSQTA
jgi:hypothetical protein